MSLAHALIPWITLSDRERMVWAADYVRHLDDPGFAAQHADAAIQDLRRLCLDQSSSLDPEYDAARSGCDLDYERFRPWYQVAWRLRHAHDRASGDPDENEIRDAFDRFEFVRSEML